MLVLKHSPDSLRLVADKNVIGPSVRPVRIPAVCSAKRYDQTVRSFRNFGNDVFSQSLAGSSDHTWPSRAKRGYPVGLPIGRDTEVRPRIVEIAMCLSAEQVSLNVSVATDIVLYEFAKWAGFEANRCRCQRMCPKPVREGVPRRWHT